VVAYCLTGRRGLHRRNAAGESGAAATFMREAGDGGARQPHTTSEDQATMYSGRDQRSDPAEMIAKLEAHEGGRHQGTALSIRLRTVLR